MNATTSADNSGESRNCPHGLTADDPLVDAPASLGAKGRPPTPHQPRRPVTQTDREQSRHRASGRLNQRLALVGEVVGRGQRRAAGIAGGAIDPACDCGRLRRAHADALRRRDAVNRPARSAFTRQYEPFKPGAAARICLQSRHAARSNTTRASRPRSVLWASGFTRPEGAELAFRVVRVVARTR
jgi:hypothetical protein